MARRSNRAIIRARAVSGKKRANTRKPHRTLAGKRARLAKSSTHLQRRKPGPNISRTRLRMIREDLEGTRSAVTDTFDQFWLIPEHNIRETLAKTERKIGRAVKMLKRAA